MNLRKSLEAAMIDSSLAKGVAKICLLRIGCGLDQLPWPTVWEIIMEIFENTGIFITVYQLPYQDH